MRAAAAPQLLREPGERVLVAFDTRGAEPDAGIGAVGALNALPWDLIAAAFGVPPSAIAQVRTELEPVVLTRCAEPGTS